MNRIIATLILSLIISYTYSQSFWGVRGNFSFSSMSSGDAASRMGFGAGVMYNTHLSDTWLFQPGVSFTLNGVKSSDRYKPDYSAYFYSIETPLLFSYRMGDEDISFGLDMGAFGRYGLFGGYWTDSSEGRIKLDIFDFQKRFDVGPQIGLSIIANNLYMGCGLQLGLIKPWESKRGNYYNYSLSFGYLFR